MSWWEKLAAAWAGLFWAAAIVGIVWLLAIIAYALGC